MLDNHLYNMLDETTNHVYSTLEERIQNGQSNGHQYNTLEEATNHVCNTLEEINERSDGHVYVYSTVKDVLAEEGHIYNILEQVVYDEVMIIASHAFRIIYPAKPYVPCTQFSNDSSLPHVKFWRMHTINISHTELCSL